MTDEVNNLEWVRELLAAGMFHDNSDAIAALLSELDTLRARLEVTPQGPDGIDARDETIRALEGEPVAWESTTAGYTKYVSDRRYRLFSEKVRAWYKPYRCSNCSIPSESRNMKDMIRLPITPEDFGVPEKHAKAARNYANYMLAQVTAERDALRADAERYRWLRHGDNDESVLMVYDNGPRPFDTRFDGCFLPRNEKLDAAIDAARGMGEAQR